jgi:pimeloyl-ACP methyl ester carboxylesterase
MFTGIFDDLRAVYPIETHFVNTDDNYILRAFRIQARNTQIVRGKPVVVL